MKILLAASEALPFFKSGGLADVARSLPDALHARGHDVRIIHPLYPSVLYRGLPLVEHERLAVPWVGGQIEVRSFLHQPHKGAAAVLLQHHAFVTKGSPYEDADPLAPARRFALFSRAVLTYAGTWGADVLHLNDWQTGLVPVYAQIDGTRIPTVFAIHNLAYQGIYPRHVLDEIGVPQDFFSIDGLEFYGNVSLIKGGIALADRIVTVSPTYAEDIQRAEYGAGMDGLLRHRGDVLHGILNGIDPTTWNPATDAALYRTYSYDDLSGKSANYAYVIDDLQMRDGPLFAVISRLVHEKGIDLVAAALPGIMELGANVVIIGDGDRAMEAQLGELRRRYPHRLANFFGFDDKRARRLYAAADFFLMPSRYEPCGFEQMIAQRYGTVPIVHATGGLVDTVRDGETGFVFEEATPEGLYGAVQRALSAYASPDFDEMRKRCMELDWSWRISAQHYEDVYRYAMGSSAG